MAVQDLRQRTFRHWIIPILIVCLAWALRLYRLDIQSFWHDEGNTARLVERSPELIIEGAAGDIHPPGYYLALHGWRALTGASEFSLRIYSALCGTATVVLVYVLGLRAGGRLAGWSAAAFMALNPLAVYYSQEARMYSQLGLVSAMTLWAAVCLVRRSSAKIDVLRVAFLALSIGAGLYTQYMYVFVLAGLNCAFAAFWLVRRRGNWALLRDWAIGHVLAALSFLPWAPIALRARGWSPPDLGAAQAIPDMIHALMVGLTLPAEPGGLLPWLLLALVLLSTLSLRRSRFAGWAAWGAAFVLPVALAGLGLYRPAYLKFLVAIVPALSVVLALPLRGITGAASTHGLWQRIVGSIAVVILVGVAILQVRSLYAMYFDPRYRRDDYRGAAALIASEVQSGDAIILSAPNQWEVFTYYYQGDIPVYPAPYHPTESEAAYWLDDLIERHQRLFVLFWGDAESDPERHIEPYLASHAYKAGDIWISSIRLARYGTGELPEEPDVGTQIQFGEAILLSGYSLAVDDCRPGDILPLTLYWQSLRTPPVRYKVFVHLLDDTGKLAAQTDMEPGAGFSLTDQWTPGSLMTDRYGVQLPKGLPDGVYTLKIGMYTFAGDRLDVTENETLLGDAYTLAQISVAVP